LQKATKFRKNMGKILINERQLEILTGHVLFEQEIDRDDSDADMKKYGHKVTSNPGEFKEYEGGQPYDLFMAKADTLSKAYFESGEFEEKDSKSFYFKYRRPNPFIAKMKVHTDHRDEWTQKFIASNWEVFGLEDANSTNKDVEAHALKMWNEEYYPKKFKQLQKLKKQLEKVLTNSKTKNKYSEEFQYASDPDERRRGGWKKNPDYDPDGRKEDKMISKAKKKVGDVTFSPTDRYVVMEKINTYVEKKYEGDYNAAMSDEVYERKGRKIYGGDGWIKRGIKSITLSPKNIKTKTIEQPQPVQTDICELFELTPTAVDGQLFENNLWGKTKFFEQQIDLLVKTIMTYKKSVVEKADGNEVTMYVSSKIYGGGGNEVIDVNTIIDYPYTIGSSCSQVPNGVNDKGEKLKGHGGTRPVSERISFEQLSKNRANTAKQLMYDKLSAIGIEMPEPIIKWQGDGSSNIPGTSGPAYKPGDPVDSEALKKARYVKIYIAIGFRATGDAPEPVPPVIFKVGDFKVQITQDVESWCGIFCKLMRLPPLRWPKWPRITWPKWGKKKTLGCPGV